MERDALLRVKERLSRAVIKILVTIAAFIIAFFLLYGAKKALGIDIFNNMTLWELLGSLFS